MHKYRYRANPKIQTANIYAEGKRAFTEGQHRAYNPYAKTNPALATIWWNGWDKSEEEREAYQNEATEAVGLKGLATIERQG